MTEQRPGEPKASLLEFLGAERGSFYHPTGEKLPYAEIHSQAKILIDLVKKMLEPLPEFQRATARAFWLWYEKDTISFQAKDFRRVTLTYYGPSHGGKSDESEYILMSKGQGSVEGETRVSISFGNDEETNKRIARRIMLSGYREGDEAPNTSWINYEGPRIRDESGHIMEVKDTQQAIDEIKIFIESLK